MKQFKRMKALVIVAVLALASVFTACGKGNTENTDGKKTYKIGLCNYVDDASLNQICDAIQSELKAIGEEKNVVFEVRYDNCNTDANVLTQIASNFSGGKTDLIIAVATPVAMTMQTQTEDCRTPVIFSAVSDPVTTKLVDSMEVPGGNLTGTSDMLNTETIVNLMMAMNPEMKKVGLLYDLGQDSSTVPVQDAKKLFGDKNVEVVEATGTNAEEVTLAAKSLVSAGVDAVFTPTDNTIMQAELAIYEIFEEAKIPHYAGADSFALNGAFLGYGVNYVELGKGTAQMAAEVLLEGKKPGELPVKTFDNGIATVNEDIAEALGLDLEKVKEVLKPFCTDVKTLKTGNEF